VNFDSLLNDRIRIGILNLKQNGVLNYIFFNVELISDGKNKLPYQQAKSGLKSKMQNKLKRYMQYDS